MEDIELLRLAAKAAELDVRPFPEWACDDWSGLIIFKDGQLSQTNWNPLTDDGDALRLAVKLMLEIDIHHTGVAVRTPLGIKVLISAEEIEDGYEATRRAIVKAAAA